MKKIFKWSLALIVFFFISATLMHAQWGGCLPCQQPYTITPVQRVPVILPEFPNCSLYVNYNILTCEGSDVRYYTDISWGIYNYDGCDDLIEYFVKKDEFGNPYIDWDAFHQISMFIFEEVSKLDFEDFPPENYPCPTSYYTTTWLSTSCSSTSIVLRNNWVEERYDLVCWETIPCEETGCCKYTNKYCYDNGILSITRSDDRESADCPQQTPPQHTCLPTLPEDIWLTSGCFAWCPERE